MEAILWRGGSGKASGRGGVGQEGGGERWWDIILLGLWKEVFLVFRKATHVEGGFVKERIV